MANREEITAEWDRVSNAVIACRVIACREPNNSKTYLNFARRAVVNFIEYCGREGIGDFREAVGRAYRQINAMETVLQ
jgi:hypothetical protein